MLSVAILSQYRSAHGLARSHFRIAVKSRRNAVIWNLPLIPQLIPRLKNEQKWFSVMKLPSKIVPFLVCPAPRLNAEMNAGISVLPSSHRVNTDYCILGKRGVSGTAPGILTNLCEMQTCVLGQYLGQQNTTFHKDARTQVQTRMRIE